MSLHLIQPGRTYRRADGTLRRVTAVDRDSRYLSGWVVSFTCWGGPNPNLRPGGGFSDLDVFVKNGVAPVTGPEAEVPER